MGEAGKPGEQGSGVSELGPIGRPGCALTNSKGLAVCSWSRCRDRKAGPRPCCSGAGLHWGLERRRLKREAGGSSWKSVA